MVDCRCRYDANEVAKLVIGECIDENKPVTNLKLQKILYFMWIDWYRLRKEGLFFNRVEAWHYGPVVPDVYFQYRIFIADPIKKREECSIIGKDAELIAKLTHKYNEKSIGTLINESHVVGSPWDRAGRDVTPYVEIKKELMIDEANRQQRY